MSPIFLMPQLFSLKKQSIASTWLQNFNVMMRIMTCRHWTHLLFNKKLNQNSTSILLLKHCIEEAHFSAVLMLYYYNSEYEYFCTNKDLLFRKSAFIMLMYSNNFLDPGSLQSQYVPQQSLRIDFWDWGPSFCTIVPLFHGWFLNPHSALVM